MDIQQFADWLAHLGASEFAKSSIPVPERAITRSATLELAGVRVIVTVVSAEPFHLELTPDGQARLGAIAAPVPTTTPDKLTPIERRVLDVLDTEHRRKAVWIAAKVCDTGRGGGGFRAILAKLKRDGLIGHEKGKGYYRMP